MNININANKFIENINKKTIFFRTRPESIQILIGPINATLYGSINFAHCFIKNSIFLLFYFIFV